VLKLDLARRLGDFSVAAELAFERRSVLVLVGESGSGKTTLLKLLAGLLAPDRGRIEVDGEVWFDGETGASLPAAKRAVGYVPQDYALFPHLTVAENVAFGLRAQGLRGRAIAPRVTAALERLGVASLAPRRPHQLSGGQQQRVAIARAIVLEPGLLLLDEPLSALDVQTRRAIRGELHRLLAELTCTTVYVTHHPTEALAFGEHIAVLEAGRISQSGTRDDLMRHPRSAYAAEFLGVNFFRGRIASHESGGIAHVRVASGELAVVDPGTDGEVTVIVHPREITLALTASGGSARNVFAGAIEALVPEPPSGDLVRVTLATHPPLVAEVTRNAADALGLKPGLAVVASFKAAGAVVVR
jgi:molybdate transport system ATP-binding protein